MQICYLHSYSKRQGKKALINFLDKDVFKFYRKQTAPK